MDETTTVAEVKKFVNNFCQERNWGQFHNPKDLAIGISTEANELLQIFRFKSDLEIVDLMKSERKKDMLDELADVFYFVLLFAQTASIDLSDILVKKLRENSEKYPVDKAKGNNKKYDEYK